MESWWLHCQLFGWSYMCALVLAASLAYLGIYVVLRRVVFIGIALIQVAAVGVAVAYLIHGNPFLFSTLATLAGVAFFACSHQERVVSQESLIGVCYAFAGALSILIIQKSAIGSDELQHYLYGQILTVTPAQALSVTGVCLVSALVHWIFHKEMVFVSFDSEMAKSLGIASRGWNMLFYLTLGAVIASATKASGVLMTFGYLVIPPVSALLVCRRMHSAWAMSISMAIAATCIGLVVQHQAQLPPGQTIVATSVVLLVCVWLWSRQRPLALALLAVALLVILFLPRHQQSANEECRACLVIAAQTEMPKQAAVKLSFSSGGRRIIPGQPFTVDMQAVNLSDVCRHFFIHLDIGIGEPAVCEFDLMPASTSQKSWQIPPSASTLWQGVYTVVPTLWADRGAMQELSFVVDWRPLTIEVAN